MVIRKVNGKSPKIPTDCFVAENATIIGDVTFGENCSVWYNAVIRGDVNSISIGNKVNIQDGAVVHCTYEKHSTVIGNNVSIGHNAIVHGCTIHDNVLIGMGSIVLDGAIIGRNSLVGAGCVVPPGKIVPPNTLVIGNPMKIIRELSEVEISNIQINKNHYLKLMNEYK